MFKVQYPMYIEIRVQWTINLGSSHMHVHAVIMHLPWDIMCHQLTTHAMHLIIVIYTWPPHSIYTTGTAMYQTMINHPLWSATQ